MKKLTISQMKNVKCGASVANLKGCDETGRCCIEYEIEDEFGGGTMEVCGDYEWYLAVEV